MTPKARSLAATRDLLSRIFDRARAQGVDQNRLAGRAGISPESLSRLKKTGTCRLTTALDLANAVGLTLDLTEPGVRRVAASIAARKLSAGRRVRIGAAELVSGLAQAEPPQNHRGHLI